MVQATYLCVLLFIVVGVVVDHIEWKRELGRIRRARKVTKWIG